MIVGIKKKYGTVSWRGKEKGGEKKNCSQGGIRETQREEKLIWKQWEGREKQEGSEVKKREVE
jgi:hypothetical protein